MFFAYKPCFAGSYSSLDNTMKKSAFNSIYTYLQTTRVNSCATRVDQRRGARGGSGPFFQNIMV